MTSAMMTMENTMEGDFPDALNVESSWFRQISEEDYSCMVSALKQPTSSSELIDFTPQSPVSSFGVVARSSSWSENERFRLAPERARGKYHTDGEDRVDSKTSTVASTYAGSDSDSDSDSDGDLDSGCARFSQCLLHKHVRFADTFAGRPLVEIFEIPSRRESLSSSSQCVEVSPRARGRQRCREFVPTFQLKCVQLSDVWDSDKVDTSGVAWLARLRCDS